MLVGRIIELDRASRDGLGMVFLEAIAEVRLCSQDTRAQKGEWEEDGRPAHNEDYTRQRQIGKRNEWKSIDCCTSLLASGRVDTGSIFGVRRQGLGSVVVVVVLVIEWKLLVVVTGSTYASFPVTGVLKMNWSLAA